jgi:hypothetical protein
VADLKAERRLTMLQALRPRTAEALHRFVRDGLGLDVSRSAVTPGSTPPFAYLCHAYFDGGDCVVWANRGGGKTMLGAVATLLDLLFKPGVQVRILGGSLEQSAKMHEHLTALLDRPLLRGDGGATSGGGILEGPATARRVKLRHGSRAELLAGSQRSVRGTRVHRLRCDEVEEFDPAVWEAAQLVTRSGVCGGVPVPGGVEGLSTMHRPFGLMSKLVAPGSGAEPAKGAEPAEASHRRALRVFKWNAMDVAARCPPQLPCAGCGLWDDCGGRAKVANGFVPIEDLIAQRRRTSDLTWQAEMMCQRPGVRDAVYPNFDPRKQVKETAGAQADSVFLGGMDFGLRSPHVMLWATVQGRGLEARVHVVDEYLVEGLTLDRHLDAIAALAEGQGWPDADQLDWVGVDPAGHQRNAHSGRTDIAWLRAAGYRVRAARSRLAEGIEIVRRRLDRGTLTLHPRCTQLIQALQSYRFDPAHPQKREPLKDGPDHACDALRYLLLNLERGGKTDTRSYLTDRYSEPLKTAR